MCAGASVEITEAVTSDDVFAIAALYPRKSDGERAEMIRWSLGPDHVAMMEGKRVILLARHDGDVVGAVQVVWENADEEPALQAPGNAVIHHLRTRPGFEGRGIASRLMDEAEALAIGRGMVQVTLGVEPGNARAMRLYRGRGYAPFHQYEGDAGEPIVGMRKSIVP